MADDKKSSPRKIKRKTLRKPSAAYALKDEDNKGDKGPDKPDKPSAESKDDKSTAGAAGDSTPAGDGKKDGGVDRARADAGAKSSDEAAQPSTDPAPAGDEPAAEPEYAALPKPRDIVQLAPNDAEPPPARAPRGDSRSFRRVVDDKEEFCLVYRSAVFLITRRGPVGKHGTWEIVQYPSQGAAAHAYAHKCSELSGEGFRDYR